MEGISVIMPSYLGEYPGSRKDPDKKFIRAVESFRSQTLDQKELIIVSDGCALTNQIYQEKWQDDPTIRLIISEKMAVTWPGELREMGRSIAKYDWIRYLDTDDIILQDHLLASLNWILKRDEGVTVLFDSHYIFPMPEKPNKLMLAYVGMDLKAYMEYWHTCKTLMGYKMTATKSTGHNGTWQIIHHKHVPHRWKNSEHIGEDAYFIKNLKTTEKWQEVRVGRYIIAHNTNNSRDIWEI